MILKNALVEEFSRYSVAAVLSTVSDWLVFILLYEFTNNAALAQGVARITGGGLSFAINKTFSFRSKENSVKREITRFLILYVFSYVLSISMVVVGAYLFSDAVYLVKLVSDSILFVFNFFMMKHFVFVPKPHTKPKPEKTLSLPVAAKISNE